jgi:hypothetical protein
MAGWIAGAIVGAGALSAIGSTVAAGQQAGAAQNATDTQLAMFNQVMGNLQPYMTAGQGALGQQVAGLNASATGGPGGGPGFLHQFGPADLASNLAPNYGWGLAQGQGAVTNANAASGGALGGNALTGMEAFTQNYAQGAYQQAFSNYQNQQNNIYSRLGNIAQLGQASATGTASGAPLFAQGISNTLVGQGAANAAGTVGLANAIGGTGTSLAAYGMLNNMTGGSVFGGGGYNPNAWNFGNLPPNPQPWGP